MDDSNMQQAMRHSHDGAAVTQLSVLRTHCVQLLRTAMASEEVNLATNSPELRNNIILMFFKVITKGFPDAVIAAREGLAVVLQTQRGKAPFKDLLQSSLRPVLVNLADYRKLTVHLLDGLSRLLELLSSWFNVTLGEKLLDYLQKWAETDKAAAPGTPKPPTKAGDEPKIPAAIIELFHLLPPAPGKFIEKLARLTIELETKLPSTGDFSSVRSPYRAPFTKFLNRFPGECLQFFYDRLLDPQLNKLLHHVLRSPMAHPVRDEVRRSEDKLIACTLMVDSSNPNHNELRFQGIQIVRTVSKFYPDWLSSRPKVLEHLIRIWQAPERWQRLSNEEGLEFEHLMESKSIIKCLLSYARTNPQDHKILFCMLNIFTVRSVVDYSFVKQFYAKDVATGFDLRHRKKIIVEFLNNCKDPAVPQDIKVQVGIFKVFTRSCSKSHIPLRPTKNTEHETLNLDAEAVKPVVPNPKSQIVNTEQKNTTLNLKSTLNPEPEIAGPPARRYPDSHGGIQQQGPQGEGHHRRGHHQPDSQGSSRSWR